MSAARHLDEDLAEPESGVFPRELAVHRDLGEEVPRLRITPLVRAVAPWERARWICGLSSIGVFPAAGMLCVFGAVDTLAYALAAMVTIAALAFAVRGAPSAMPRWRRANTSRRHRV